VHWHHARAHDHADAFGILTRQLKPTVRDREPRRPNGKAARTAHDLQALPLSGRQKRHDVKVVNLGGDLDWMGGGVGTPNRTDAGSRLTASLPEGFFADPVGGDDPQPGHHHSTHGSPPFGSAARWRATLPKAPWGQLCLLLKHHQGCTSSDMLLKRSDRLSY